MSWFQVSWFQVGWSQGGGPRGVFPGDSPAVDGGVAVSQPANPWQLLLLASGTQVDHGVVLRHHEVQRTHHVPAVRQTGRNTGGNTYLNNMTAW